jgi:hypothetical protein
MVKVAFEEISLFGKKSGPCSRCGRKVTRSKRFWQTRNPFNKLTDGRVKTTEDIMSELEDERRRWMDEPVCHYDLCRK